MYTWRFLKTGQLVKTHSTIWQIKTKKNHSEAN